MTQKLTVVATDRGVEIIGNRKGLMGFAMVCLQLAMLPDDEAEAQRLGGNHWHFGETFGNTEPGSLDLMVLFKPDL